MAEIKVSLDHPQMMKGDPLDLGGLCVVENGSSVTVDDERQEIFKAVHGVTAREYYKNDPHIKISSAGGGDKD